MMEADDEKTQLRYAHALANWGDAGGYDAEVLWDTVTVAALGIGVRAAASTASSPRCPAASRSGWRWRRCCAGRTRCCCWTSRTTTSTCPASSGWRSGCSSTPKTVLFVSHDRELLARAADRVVTVEGGTGLGARRRLRHLPRGPRGTGTSGWPSCAGAGTRSTPGSRSWSGPCSSRPRSHRTWPRGTGRCRPGWPGSRPTGRRRTSRRSRRSPCGCAAAGPACGR